MKIFKTILFGALAVLVLATAYQTGRIFVFGKRADYGIKPFERMNPSAQLKILFLGDSTIVGTGTNTNTQSTAGWFGQEFPRAEIINISQNGRKLDGLLKAYHPTRGEHYNLVIAQIGANDIMHWTPYHKIETEINQLIDRLEPIAGTIVILHSGDIGLAPMFSWPFDEILGWRSRKVREIYMRTARERHVLYVDLLAERSNDLFLKDIGLYYSPDLLHPSGEGYRWWYHRIRQTLDAAGVKLRD